MAILAAAHVRRFGVEPKIALLSHSDFGSYEYRLRPQDARGARLILAQAPELEVDGEMHGESALIAGVPPARLSALAAAPARRTC